MKSFGMVPTDILNDEQFISMSRGAREVYVYFHYAPHITSFACARIPAAYIADDLRISVDEAKSDLREVEEAGLIEIGNNGWLRIVGFFGRNMPTNPKHCDGIIKHLMDLANRNPYLAANAAQEILGTEFSLNENQKEKLEKLASYKGPAAKKSRSRPTADTEEGSDRGIEGVSKPSDTPSKQSKSKRRSKSKLEEEEEFEGGVGETLDLQLDAAPESYSETEDEISASNSIFEKAKENQQVNSDHIKKIQPELDEIIDLRSSESDRLTKQKTKLEAEIRQVFEHYRTYHPQSFRRVHQKLKEWSKIRDRLRDDGFSVSEICLAIDGCHKSKFHSGLETGTKYQKLELIVRDAGHVQQFIEIANGEQIFASKKTLEGYQQLAGFEQRSHLFAEYFKTSPPPTNEEAKVVHGDSKEQSDKLIT